MTKQNTRWWTDEKWQQTKKKPDVIYPNKETANRCSPTFPGPFSCCSCESSLCGAYRFHYTKLSHTLKNKKPPLKKNSLKRKKKTGQQTAPIADISINTLRHQTTFLSNPIFHEKNSNKQTNRSIKVWKPSSSFDWSVIAKRKDPEKKSRVAFRSSYRWKLW